MANPFRKIKKRQQQKYGMEGVRLKDFKRRLYQRQKGCCIYCDRKIHFNQLTIDHIIPMVVNQENFVLACERCNALKSDYYLGYYQYLNLKDFTEEFLSRILLLQLYLTRRLEGETK